MYTSRVQRNFQLKVAFICIFAIGTFTTLWGALFLLADGPSMSKRFQDAILLPRNPQELFSRFGVNLTAMSKNPEQLNDSFEKDLMSTLPNSSPGIDLMYTLLPDSINTSPESSLKPPSTSESPNHSSEQKSRNSTTVLDYIRSNHLTPPPTTKTSLAKSRSFRNRKPKPYTLPGMLEVLGNITTGVFIEAGAWDGVASSNTLYLEEKGWKGILVECNPQILPKLMKRKRNAWVADVCLSITGNAGTVKFYSPPEWGPSAQINRPLTMEEMKQHGIDWMKNKTWSEYVRPSFTLQSIIAAVGEFEEIDFLSLDVQGAEKGVLEHYPFELFPIKVIQVEVFSFNDTEREKLTAFLNSNGYTFHGELGLDYVYVLESLLNKSSTLSVRETIRVKHLTPPSTKTYNFQIGPGHEYENKYTKLVYKIFGDKTDGVFIEAGAFDGVDGSNTLHFELKGWKGLLVECNPQSLPKLQGRNRKAWIADVCLSTTGKAGTVKFYSSPEWPASAQIDKQLSIDEMNVHGIGWLKNKTWTEYEAPSFTLQSILAAIGEFEEIDLLSLDVQGAEIGVLKNYPFELFPIKVLIVEVFTFNSTTREDLKTFMTSKGYKLFANLDNNYDHVFVQNHLV